MLEITTLIALEQYRLPDTDTLSQDGLMVCISIEHLATKHIPSLLPSSHLIQISTCHVLSTSIRIDRTGDRETNLGGCRTVELDGNVSLTSSFCDSDNDATVHNITVQTGYRPHMNPQLSSIRLPPVRKTVRRDNKVLQAVSLPKLSNYNMRSFLPKIENFGINMHDRNCSLSFLTEVWEKSENKKHQLKIEELLELKGLKYISTPRPSARRGGGL